MFQWDTLRDAGRHIIPFKDPIVGRIAEVALTNGPVVRAFRADDGLFYFCHGLTFGGKTAPGGPISPFSGPDVQTILRHQYQQKVNEAEAIPGDILVWFGAGTETPHSAILSTVALDSSGDLLDYTTILRSKNGKLPEGSYSLEQLIDEYGHDFRVFRRT
jgi:hypothetical protein